LTGYTTRNRLHDRLVRHLALQVMQHGDLAIGEASTEGDLSRELKVSRTVLREAIKVLEAKGLVEVQQRRGVRVRPKKHWNLLDPDLLAWRSNLKPDERFIRHMHELRLILEPAAAELAAMRASDPEIEALFHYLSSMERAVHDVTSFIAADMEFHSAIFTACHNDLLEQITVTIGRAFRATRVITIQRRGSSATSIQLHFAVADAIRNKDSVLARSAMQCLLEQAGKDINAVLRGEHNA
jgi:GntR family transcriptional regulator, galactonate operon transcriptional repressor